MHARLLVISPMDILDIHRIVAIAKQLNPQIQVLICAESKEEAAVIRDENIGEVFYAKEEMAKEYEPPHLKSDRACSSVNGSLTPYKSVLKSTLLTQEFRFCSSITSACHSFTCFSNSPNNGSLNHMLSNNWSLLTQDCFNFIAKLILTKGSFSEPALRKASSPPSS